MSCLCGKAGRIGTEFDSTVQKSVEGEEPYELQVENEPIILHVTLVKGVKRYPELEELKPIRGEQDLTCDMCGGTGIHPLDEFSVLCYCGGAG
jgi:hypothetical protein